MISDFHVLALGIGSPRKLGSKPPPWLRMEVNTGLSTLVELLSLVARRPAAAAKILCIERLDMRGLARSTARLCDN